MCFVNEGFDFFDLEYVMVNVYFGKDCIFVGMFM